MGANVMIYRLKEKVKRSKWFWNMEETDRPLFSINIGEIDPGTPAITGDTEKDFRNWEKYVGQLYEVKGQYDDTFPAVYPWNIFGHALMPGIIGCPTGINGGVWWSEPVLDDWGKLSSLNFSLKGRVFEQLCKYYEYFEKKVQEGIFPAAYPILGPIDLACAIRGSEKLCMDVYDHPEELKELMERCTVFCIEFAKFTLKKAYVAQIEGLISSAVNIWYLENRINAADDNSILFSPATLNTIFSTYERRFMQEFEGALFEIHSASIHTYPLWFNMDKIEVVKITIDPSDSGCLFDILDRFEEIKGSKRFLINCEYRDIEGVIKRFGSKGLAINTFCESIGQAEELLANSIKWSEKS